jgi:hypothetical protein
MQTRDKFGSEGCFVEEEKSQVCNKAVRCVVLIAFVEKKVDQSTRSKGEK